MSSHYDIQEEVGGRDRSPIVDFSDVNCVFVDNDVTCNEVLDDTYTPVIFETGSEHVDSSVPKSVDNVNGSDVHVKKCVYNPPVSREGRVVEIYEECLNGSCACENLIGGVFCNLRPCRVGKFLFSGECNLPSVYVDGIWNGLCDGFRIVNEVCSSSYDCKNYLSISEGPFRREMSILLKQEILEGKVSKCSKKPRCVHSLGAVPKSDGRLRPITDCSMPNGTSINNFMDETCDVFKYNSVNDVAIDLNKGDFMCVVDIASAYRSVPIYPPHSEFQGFRWDFDDGRGEIFLRENRLCFGLKCAPYIFSQLSDLIVDMAKAKGIFRIVNYLDDFIITESSYEKCLENQRVLLSILRHIGFSVSWKKVSPPSTLTTFLGIQIDSVEMNLSVPQDKIDKLIELICNLKSKGRATKKELERSEFLHFRGSCASIFVFFFLNRPRIL